MNWEKGKIFKRILIAILFPPLFSFGQKFTFSHLDIEDGLIQSQVTHFAQDSKHRLWIATFGGACRFDGKDYLKISKSKGLSSNFVYTVFVDKHDRLWIGTDDGLLCTANGKNLRFAVSPGHKNNTTTAIAAGKDGTIYCLVNNKLYRVRDKSLVAMQITGSDELLTCFNISDAGVIYAAVYNKGVYSFDHNKWTLQASSAFKGQTAVIGKILFDKFKKGNILLCSTNNVFQLAGGELKPYADNLLAGAAKPFSCIEQDADGNLWIGSVKGAYCIKSNKIIGFNSQNGFTDNPVIDIYNDVDNNLWLGTSGSGAYKYEGDGYLTANPKVQTNNSQIIIGLAKTKNGEVLANVSGTGIMKYEQGVLSPYLLPTNNLNTSLVSCLFTDRQQNIWIGTNFGGLWRSDGAGLKMFPWTTSSIINVISQAADGAIWFGTSLGCYRIAKNGVQAITRAPTFVSTLLPLGADSVLIGTHNGVQLAVGNKIVLEPALSFLDRSSVYSMLRVGNAILFGTDDKGVFVWQVNTNKYVNIDVAEGLKSSSIYCMAADNNGQIWVGTGKGVNRLKKSSGRLMFKVLNNSYPKSEIAEANQGSLLLSGDEMLLGTTKGLKIYKTAQVNPRATPPQTVLNEVRIYGKNGKYRSLMDDSAAAPLKLSHDQNHIAISFLGIHLKDPESVTYQYRLTGLNDKFSQPVKNPFVEYFSLPPGKYCFEIISIDGNGRQSGNSVLARFEIVPAFYQGTIFKIIVLLAFLICGIIIQTLWHQKKKRRKMLLESIKKEEVVKIRQQTAEDFHDDLGNKLTRISILSEILQSRMGEGKEEERKLVEQIKSNTLSLYNGTKDILWALNPRNDNLYEILRHIKEIGIEQFADTAISFEMTGLHTDLKQYRLNMEHSRNLLMIFKELINNVLKHAHATSVRIIASRQDNEKLLLAIRDDGVGFEPDMLATGYGMNNIKARAKRINAQLSVESSKGAGTITKLIINLKQV
ncbi:two-component regulator propeller domain-containing protein [Mucilaginibacter sp. AK015]|uniref:ligand-binding sensor domain-containing protein n=1 Tax=Mucilaginibacter sp. AK015 TaxID=2723072 RepID=UPI001614AB9C|nr:sensor histidine kinase [Mucilaginibacter sp. AK015]MBB5395292.1 signal transduction histidine kinase/ligand-binding sensor domain-containing protein [Mucilaginibacter sp. AK015]